MKEQALPMSCDGDKYVVSGFVSAVDIKKRLGISEYNPSFTRFAIKRWKAEEGKDYYRSKGYVYFSKEFADLLSEEYAQKKNDTKKCHAQIQVTMCRGEEQVVEIVQYEIDGELQPCVVAKSIYLYLAPESDLATWWKNIRRWKHLIDKIDYNKSPDGNVYLTMAAAFEIASIATTQKYRKKYEDIKKHLLKIDPTLRNGSAAKQVEARAHNSIEHTEKEAASLDFNQPVPQSINVPSKSDIIDCFCEHMDKYHEGGLFVMRRNKIWYAGVSTSAESGKGDTLIDAIQAYVAMEIAQINKRFTQLGI
ncbi:MAG: hypothetical protein H7843_09035 [Nitrospirota bacterium]